MVELSTYKKILDTYETRLEEAKVALVALERAVARLGMPGAYLRRTTAGTTTEIGRGNTDRILKALAKSPKLSSQLKTELKLSDSGIYGGLKRLRDRGLVISQGGLWGLTEKALHPKKTLAPKRKMEKGLLKPSELNPKLQPGKATLMTSDGRSVAAVREEAILTFLTKHPEAYSAKAINAKLGMARNYTSVYPYLHQLLKAGKVHNESGSWQVNGVTP